MGDIQVMNSSKGTSLYVSGAARDDVLVPEAAGKFLCRVNADLLGAGEIELSEVVLQTAEKVSVDRSEIRTEPSIASRVDLTCEQEADGIHVTLVIEGSVPMSPPALVTRVIVDTMTVGRGEFSPTTFTFSNVSGSSAL